MVEVSRAKYPLNPTLKLVTPEGRATAEFFRILRAIGDLIENITLEDGEVTADKISVENLSAISAILGDVIIGGTLTVGGYIVTGNVAPNAISELSGLTQGGTNGPDGETLTIGTVPIGSTNNTGLQLTFTSFMDKPAFDPSNFGYWGLHLRRNGTIIKSTPALYYDDNFSYQPVASFIDPTPGPDPEYAIESYLLSGPGNFTISGGVLNVGLLKR